MIANEAEYLQQVKSLSKSLAAELPDTFSGFAKLHAAAGKDGALSAKTKEVIALAIAVATHCEGCIVYHVNAALKAGATRAEILDGISVAILMGGGPAVMYACEAWRAVANLSESA